MLRKAISRASCKTPCPSKIALLSHFAALPPSPTLLEYVLGGGARGRCGPGKLTQNHRFFWGREFCNWLIFFCLCASVGFANPRPDSLPYISGDTFRSFSDHVFDEAAPLFDPSKVKPGDTIFINLSHIAEFFKLHHPNIQSPYILISFNHDFSAPAEYRSMLEEEKLIAWFTQNADLVGHPKLIPIPIGLCNVHWGHSREFSRLIANAQKSLQPEKNCLLYVNFDVTTNPKLREPIYDYFKQHVPFCTMAPRRPYSQYALFLDDLAHAKFVLSPHGGGLDCHRTWEAMYMGSIPIVKASTLDSLYEGLPVLIVDEWSDITLELLEKKYAEMKGKTYQREKLYFDYWLRQIREKQKNYRPVQPGREEILSLIHLLEDNSLSLEPLIAAAKNRVLAVCPQQRRVAELEQRIEAARQTMLAKVKEKKDQTTPFLSFVMPCHNRASVLHETIESIYSQNLPFPFEVIAVDDASTDCSFEVLQRYEGIYDNFFAFKNEVNKKSAATRNVGTCYARGEYICNADSDDLFEPDTVGPLLQTMIQHGNEVAYFQELRYFHHMEDPRGEVDRTPPQKNDEILLKPYLIEMHISPCAGNKIYSKRSWLKSGGYLERPGHDTWTFSYKLLANGYAGTLPLGTGYRHRLWKDQTNVWMQDLKNNVHDISPQQAVLEHPEFFHPASFALIENYQPSGAEFMFFLHRGIKDETIAFANGLDDIVQAYYHENNQRYELALRYYAQAIEQGEAHLNIYLRAAYVALLSHQKDKALALLKSAI